MSSDVHRILTTEPERSAAGEQGRSQTACRHDFLATNAPSSDTKAGDSGASILQDGQSVCRRPTALEPDRPRAATECSLCAPTTADGPRPRAVHIGGSVRVLPNRARHSESHDRSESPQVNLDPAPLDWSAGIARVAGRGSRQGSISGGTSTSCWSWRAKCGMSARFRNDLRCINMQPDQPLTAGVRSAQPQPTRRRPLPRTRSRVCRAAQTTRPCRHGEILPWMTRCRGSERGRA